MGLTVTSRRGWYGGGGGCCRTVYAVAAKAKLMQYLYHTYPKDFPYIDSSCASTRLFVSLLFSLVNINVMTCDNRVEFHFFFLFINQ